MTTTIATRPKNEVATYLEDHIGELTPLCSGQLTPARLIALAVICTYKTPKILDCDKASVLASVIQGASMGLDLNPSAGEFYLVPRWNKNSKSLECTGLVGYQGLTKLCRNTGTVSFIQARLVRENDKFRVWYDPEIKLEHEPVTKPPLSDIVYVYAMAKLADGNSILEMMSADEVEYIRSRSESPDKGPWQSDWGEMAKKTVIRRLCKSLPKSAELIRAMEAIDTEIGLDRAQIEGPSAGAAGGVDRPAIDNQSGHATGKYASPEETAAYLLKMTTYLEERNARWADRWAALVADGTLGPVEVKELCSRWHADNHLVKWAKGVGLIDPHSCRDEGVSPAQIGRFTAIIWHRSTKERNQLARELGRYLDELEENALAAIQKAHLELFEPEGDDEPPWGGAADSSAQPAATVPVGRAERVAASQAARAPAAIEATPEDQVVRGEVISTVPGEAQPKPAAPKSELRAWIDDTIVGFDTEMKRIIGNGDVTKLVKVTAYQVGNAVLNEAIEASLINDRAIIDDDGKRDRKKSATVLQALWDEDQGWVQDTVGKYLAQKVQGAMEAAAAAQAALPMA